MGPPPACVRPLLVLALAALLGGCVGGGADPAPPSSAPARHAAMASLGDSITMAANLDSSRVGDNPGHSWASGLAADDGVESHAERLGGDARNGTRTFARSGARMADLERQAELAVAQGARYVTVLMGANDACARTSGSMTPVESFRRQFREAARTLEGLPEGAVVYVASIPDVTKLREAFWNDSQARAVWRALGVCPSILSEQATPEDVEAARVRLAAYNRVLREECAAAGFAFDDEAVFREPVRREDVSPLDYFHPSLKGQARLAEIIWAAGPFAAKA